jgi:hypothetical protein
MRASVLGAPDVSATGLGTLHRRGMAAWIRGISTVQIRSSAIVRPANLPPASGASSANELTILLASLVVTLTAEPAHV